MKKIVCCILTCCFLFIALGSYNSLLVNVEAEELNNVTYTLSEDGTYYILNKCTDYTSDVITVPKTVNGKPVKEIGQLAFASCMASRIILPDTMVSIGASAFFLCEKLTEVVIPKSVQYIGSGIFADCSSMTFNEYDNGLYYGNASNPYLLMVGTKSRDITSCRIHEDTVFMPDGFYQHKKITSVYIPASVKYLDFRAIAGCDSLTSVTVSPDNKVYCSINNCIIEKATKTLIAGCGTSVIPTNGSVTAIGNSAFWRCNSLTEIVIPSPIESVGTRAFSNCKNLVKVYIADSVVTMGDEIFSDCISLTDAYCEASEKPAGWGSWFPGTFPYSGVNMHWGYESDVFNSSVSIGDINGNNKLDARDYLLLKRAFFGTYELTCDFKIVDINGNGKLDARDYLLLKRAFFGTYTIK